MTVGTNALLEGRVAVQRCWRPRASPTSRSWAGRPAPSSTGSAPETRRRSCPPSCACRCPSGAGPTACCARSRRRRCSSRLAGLEAPEAFAVCLLWGFRHPGTSVVAGELASGRTPARTCRCRTRRRASSASTSAVPRPWSTPRSPPSAPYLERLTARASDAGLPEPEVMLSSGGVAGAEAASRHGSWTVLSGPAGGAVGAARAARRAPARPPRCAWTWAGPRAMSRWPRRGGRGRRRPRGRRPGAGAPDGRRSHGRRRRRVDRLARSGRSPPCRTAVGGRRARPRLLRARRAACPRSPTPTSCSAAWTRARRWPVAWSSTARRPSGALNGPGGRAGARRDRDRARDRPRGG